MPAQLYEAKVPIYADDLLPDLQRTLAALHRIADTAGQLDWSLHMMDSTIIRARQHAAGAKGG